MTQRLDILLYLYGRKILLASTLFCLVIGSAVAQGDTNSYSFFIAGHTYGANGVNNVGLHPPFRAKFGYIRGRLGMRMGFLTGDIVPNPKVQDWDEVDADIDSLQMPVHLVAGNHDLRDKPLFESRYGSTYYKLRFKDDLFIVLDANENGWSIKGQQLQFLKNTLDSNANSSANIFVFFHQVLWRTDNNAFRHVVPNSNEGRQLPLNFWTELVPLFSALPNQVNMFAGDVGVSWASSISMDRYRNINFIASGMGGTPLDNFVIVNVDSAKKVNFEVICLNDTSLNCLGSLEDYIVVDSVGSIEEGLANKTVFSIYPNPVSEVLTIIADEAISMHVQLYHISGQLALEKEVEASKMEKIQLHDYPRGLYVLTIKTSTGVYLEKIVVE